MDWDDLRYFDAVAQAGSLAGAARALNVNHSTVFRRLNRLEQNYGVRLFERHREGYSLSVAGEEMQQSVFRIGEEVAQLDRRLTGRDLSLSGTLTVTTTDTLMHRFLGPHLAAFRKRYQDVSLDVVLDTQYLNLSKRQADVAVRPTMNPPETLVGRRIADIGFAVYGSKDYLQHVGARRSLADYDWLGFEESLTHLAAAKWMRARLPNAKIGFRANNLMALTAAAAAGMGVAILPCFLGDQELALERLEMLPAKSGSALWLLTHADLRNTARVRAFMDCMAERISGDRAVLEGR
jgi:DNA-binding transcriptional LysR family regulator